MSVVELALQVVPKPPQFWLPMHGRKDMPLLQLQIPAHPMHISISLQLGEGRNFDPLTGLYRGLEGELREKTGKKEEEERGGLNEIAGRWSVSCLP